MAASMPRMKTSWKLLQISLPFNKYDLFTQQLDSGKIVIMGGKTKLSQHHQHKGYLLEVSPEIKTDKFYFCISEIQEIKGNFSKIFLDFKNINTENLKR